MPINQLLSRIKRAPPIKVISTINFWISCNLISKDKNGMFWRMLANLSSLLVEPGTVEEAFCEYISQWKMPIACDASDNILNSLLDSISCLFVLGILEPALFKEKLKTAFQMSEECKKSSKLCHLHKCISTVSPGCQIPHLKALTIRQIRDITQQRMLSPHFTDNSLHFRDSLVPSLHLPGILLELLIHPDFI
ncbi:hypothetical protein Ciccas_000603 [Cichlidogyrus casuarinus]|uniref:Maturase K n=1 Tax=Cichlidogyrus casuarinus TaxID=1844966 RepID=A0ABD2QMD1_9PLAT